MPILYIIIVFYLACKEGQVRDTGTNSVRGVPPKRKLNNFGKTKGHGEELSPCLVASKISKFYKILRHIKSLNAYMKY